MLTLSSTDLDALLALFLFPFVRILAWLSVDPLLGNKAVPTGARVTLAFALTLVIAPLAPPVAPVSLVSADGVLVLLQQIAVGIALGFAARLVFAAVEYAGQFMALQMGLSFATLFDPINGAQTPVMAQFLVLTTALLLFAFNGHHVMISALAHTFEDIPVGATLSGGGFATLAQWGGTVFASGLHIALPVTAALLATNLTIGMMSRAAPQLNIFAVGFPLSLSAGFFVLYLTLTYLPAQVERLWLRAIEVGVAATRGIGGG